MRNIFGAALLAMILGACGTGGGEARFDAVPVPAEPGLSGSSTTGTPSAARMGSSVARIVDINSAQLDELQSLPDIGRERAQAIVANRPFASIDELVEKRILPQSQFDQINDRIVAR
jgi:competence protein ComEA